MSRACFLFCRGVFKALLFFFLAPSTSFLSLHDQKHFVIDRLALSLSLFVELPAPQIFSFSGRTICRFTLNRPSEHRMRSRGFLVLRPSPSQRFFFFPVCSSSLGDHCFFRAGLIPSSFVLLLPQRGSSSDSRPIVFCFFFLPFLSYILEWGDSLFDPVFFRTYPRSPVLVCFFPCPHR